MDLQKAAILYIIQEVDVFSITITIEILRKIGLYLFSLAYLIAINHDNYLPCITAAREDEYFLAGNMIAVSIVHCAWGTSTTFPLEESGQPHHRELRVSAPL